MLPILYLHHILLQRFRHAVSHHLTVHFTLTALLRPYIVYMLQDLDILEDWTAIRKVFWKRTKY